MKSRTVVLSQDAINDLLDLYDWIASKSDPVTALGYIERIEDFCLRLDIASERGQARDDIRPGLRIVGFERRLLIAFTVDEESVTILRLFSGGQRWEMNF
ncbi:MAG: type II toxin-antitoxin system RelE/ParE family toxin [Parvibaculaceae bacterium]